MLTTLAFLQNIGAVEILIVGVAALLLFGTRLPSVARNIGKGLTQFKRGVRDATNEVKREMDAAAAEVESTSEPIPDEKLPQHEIASKPDATAGAPKTPSPSSPPSPEDAARN